jgi:hypothetical protein
MKRLSLFVLALVLCSGAAPMLLSGLHQRPSLSINRNVGEATDGAFRDGLYLGGLAARRGSEPHIAAARWATNQDRAAFAAGYQQGYAESLAVPVAAVDGFRQSE